MIPPQITLGLEVGLVVLVVLIVILILATTFYKLKNERDNHFDDYDHKYFGSIDEDKDEDEVY